MPKGAAVAKKASPKKPPKENSASKKAGPKKPILKKPASKKPAAKKPAAKKRSKKAASDDEGELEGEEDELQPDVVAEDEGDGDAVMRVVHDDDVEAPDDHKKTDKQKADAAVKRANKKARSRGYRGVATKAGYSAEYATSDQSRDVASNVVTVNETRRAAGWYPKIDGKVAFGTIGEFKERLEIANEPLPPRAAEVVRASLEVFMRRLAGDSLQSAFDVGSKRIKPEHVMPHTRKLQRHLKYTLDAPKGVIRYAQQEKEGERIRIPDSDVGDIANADPEMVQAQLDAKNEQQVKEEKREAKKMKRIADAKAKKAARVD